MKNGIGENIARRRKELGWTQEELATKMGYKSKSSINKIELGLNDIPQSKIVKFAEALGTTPAALMGWSEMQKNNDTMASIIVKMRTDQEFFEAVNLMYSLSEEKFASVKQMLTLLK